LFYWEKRRFTLLLNSIGKKKIRDLKSIKRNDFIANRETKSFSRGGEGTEGSQKKKTIIDGEKEAFSMAKKRSGTAVRRKKRATIR